LTGGVRSCSEGGKKTKTHDNTIDALATTDRVGWGLGCCQINGTLCLQKLAFGLLMACFQGFGHEKMFKSRWFPALFSCRGQQQQSPSALFVVVVVVVVGRNVAIGTQQSTAPRACRGE
jgi:hypothetical protein